MGWYTNYRMLYLNKCLTADALKKKVPTDYKYANTTNMPDQRARGWRLGEEKLKELHKPEELKDFK